ncbi:tryptophan 7-halogenase [Marinobacterium arenosum]|uniref:tryptophan 7-halogenase n=1 Tax=Marinobacterium arenosum TaxID=2862496 RepID=UPI001C94903F|nr:tryptophan 7-halogenase [Marinobacterium arenosum]MBY4676169.1 tryptophan 7-halogenase [Marinobacterium arenosum]
MTVSDCVVFGGGPAGCAAAIRLRQRAQADVLLVDRAAPAGRYQIGESAAPAVVPLLAELGLRQDLAELGHLPCYGNRSIWGGDAVNEQDFLFKGQGFGWHLDRATFDRQLRDQARECGVKFLDGLQLQRLGWLPKRQCWGLELSDELGGKRQLLTRSLVDATGNRALIAQRMGATRRRLDTLMAVAVLTKLPGGLDNLSLIEATEHGWWYAADIPGQRQVIAFMTDADILKQQELAECGQFSEQARRSELLPSLLADLTDGSELFVYPAHSAYLDRVSGPGWLALGNAAMSLDPLTASGIHCALQDGIRGADALLSYLDGDSSGLVGYAQATDQALRHYLSERLAYYRLEQRWPQATFWQRRHQPTT